MCMVKDIFWGISIHALREEGDAAGELSSALRRWISIHALREEGDRFFSRYCTLLAHFYPRPPRGGRQAANATADARRKFLSTPSARRATHRRLPVWLVLCHFYPRPPRGGRPCGAGATLLAFLFLSTPSARRATCPLVSSSVTMLLFLSTPSARRATPYHRTGARLRWNFYPRPPRGGRLVIVTNYFHAFIFLSTPSARRATR